MGPAPPLPVTQRNVRFSRQPLEPPPVHVTSPRSVVVLLLLSARDCAKGLRKEPCGGGGNCVRRTCELAVRWPLEPERSRERAGPLLLVHQYT